MSIRRSEPFRWPAIGCSDSLETTEVFKGAMSSLQNLIPDPTTKNLWVPRPAAVQKTDFTGFTTPGFISAQIVVGDRVYGMIASGRNAGKDEPFCYDLVAGAFVTISGVTGANTPTSPSPTGAWTPPSLALVGTYVVVCHPGFSGANFVGWLNISNPAALAWSAGNTATNALPVAPSFVAQFNGRAYYGCNPATGQPSIIASDVLDPTTRTNGTYVLTFDDNVPLITAQGLPLENQLGGIIQSLIVFKSNNCYQITGDFASTTTPIAKNALNVSTGTQAPNAVCVTPKGIAFIAPDGLRFIDFNARMSDPVGDAGAGITLPFSQVVVPSRMCADCNSTTIRISVQNGAVAGNPNQEWWFNLSRGVWCGPHTFPASLINAYGISFILSPIAVTASLFQSDTIPTSLSVYTENGAAMQFVYETANFPDPGKMANYAVVETLIYMAYPPDSPGFVVVAENQDEAVLDQTMLQANTGAVSIWGAFNWGSGAWGGFGSALAPRQVKWTKPVMFTRWHVRVVGTCAYGLQLGDVYGRWQLLGYEPTG